MKPLKIAAAGKRVQREVKLISEKSAGSSIEPATLGIRGKLDFDI